MDKKIVGVQVPDAVEQEIKQAALEEFTTVSAILRRWLYKGAESEGVILRANR